eukprot:15430290-Alexandrium_andersonii.AAC.2
MIMQEQPENLEVNTRKLRYLFQDFLCVLHVQCWKLCEAPHDEFEALALTGIAEPNLWSISMMIRCQLFSDVQAGAPCIR